MKKIDRRSFLKVAGLSTVSLALSGCIEGRSETRDPNIVFIIVDDLGPFDLGCYGGNNRVEGCTVVRMDATNKTIDITVKNLAGEEPGTYQVKK